MIKDVNGPGPPFGLVPCCVTAFPEAAVQAKRSKILAGMVPMQAKRPFIFYKTAPDQKGFEVCHIKQANG